MQIELQNHSFFLREESFEVVDLPISTLPNFLGHEFVNSLDEDALIVATVEDYQFSSPGHPLVIPPKEIVV